MTVEYRDGTTAHSVSDLAVVPCAALDGNTAPELKKAKISS